MDEGTFTNNLSMYVTNDGSIDYLVDWDSFSIENELEARKRIYKENFQALKLIAGSSSSNSTEDMDMKQLKIIEDVSHKLKNNMVISSDYEKLYNRIEYIKQEVQNLKVKNKLLENKIKDLEKELPNKQKAYREQKDVLLKGVKMFTTCFDLKVDIKNVPQSPDVYEASLQFGLNKNTTPVKFLVHRTKRKVLDFDTNGTVTNEEELDIRRKYGDLNNIPGLVSSLREIILKNKMTNYKNANTNSAL